jgi:hypothetical protein
MKHFATLTAITIVIFFTFVTGTVSAATSPATLGKTLNGASAVHFVFEDWRHDAHIAYEYAQASDGSWWSFREREGLTAQASANITAWIQAILDLETTSDLQLAQPSGLDLNSADDTPTTVGHTPVDFCANILFANGENWQACLDRSADGSQLWANVWNATFHEAGWYAIDPSSESQVFNFLPAN